MEHDNKITDPFFRPKYVVAGSIFVFLIVFSMNKLMDMYISFAEFKASSPERSITISAEGKVEAVPDIATTNFSVVSEGKDAKTVQKNNSDKINAVLAFLKSEGVAEKDVKTTNYDLYPEYDYRNYPTPSGSGLPNPIIGYRLTQTLTVKIRDLNKVGEILEGVVSRGINQTGGVSFDIDDPDNLKDQARTEAFAKAREKAAALVGQSGAHIGRIVNIIESDFSVPPIPYYGLDGLGGGAEVKTSAPQIQPGTQEVRGSVTVVFELL